MKPQAEDVPFRVSAGHGSSPHYKQAGSLVALAAAGKTEVLDLTQSLSVLPFIRIFVT